MKRRTHEEAEGTREVAGRASMRVRLLGAYAVMFDAEDAVQPREQSRLAAFAFFGHGWRRVPARCVRSPSPRQPKSGG
jgi:citrate lyase beta subunit